MVRWSLFVLAAIAGIATAFVTFAIASTPVADPTASPPIEPTDLSALRTWQLWLAVGTALLVLAQKIADSQSIRQRKLDLKAVRTQFYEVFDGPLNRLLKQVKRMAAIDPGNRETQIEAIRHSVVQSTAQLVAPKETRASFFTLEDPAALKGARILTGVKYNYSDNRRDDATTSFDEKSDPTNEVWRALDEGEAIVYPDLTKHSPAGWDASRIYKCFVTVGVRGFGVLTVNSMLPNDLQPTDVTIVTALAEVLGVAETVAAAQS